MLGFNAYLPPTRQQTATPAAQHEKRKGRKKMKLVAAFLLAVLGGNPSPSAEDINKILASVGAEAESDRTELLLSQLQDRDIAEVMAAGRQQLASVPAGAGAGVAVAVSSSGGAAAAAADTPEPKKEEKVEEKEESDEDMGFSLFD